MALEGKPSVLVDSADGVLRLTLNRPEKRNALDRATLDLLLDALARAREDSDVRCVLLAGAPPAFCAGGDIEWMEARQGDPLATKRAQETGFGAAAREILRLPKPVVAKVNGDAFGAGLALCLAADYAIASDAARFGATFSRVALVPDAAASWLLPKTLGIRAARELVLVGEPVDARRAEQLGVVNRVVPSPVLDREADALVRRLAQGPTRALGLAKRQILDATASTLDQALADEAALQAVCFGLEDHREGVAAFREKRPPRFVGR